MGGDVSALEKHACPACGAQAEWNPTKQKLVCPFCGTESAYAIDRDAGKVAERDLSSGLRDSTAAEAEWQQQRRSVQCQSCRAIMVYDAARVGQNCEFCGSPALVAYEDIKSPIRPEGVLPFCIVLFLPVAFFAPKLYLWAQPAVVSEDHILQMKAGYLNLPFWLVRAAVCFGFWWFCSMLLNKWSAAQDRGELGITEADTRRFRVVSAPGLVFFILLMSLAAIDWIMSLDPHWFSTIYGLIQVVGQGLCALSFSVAVLTLLSARPPLQAVLRTSHFHDLGKLMLALVMLWA